MYGQNKREIIGSSYMQTETQPANRDTACNAVKQSLIVAVHYTFASFNALYKKKKLSVVENERK
jgi:hypothetical protein